MLHFIWHDLNDLNEKSIKSLIFRDKSCRKALFSKKYGLFLMNTYASLQWTWLFFISIQKKFNFFFQQFLITFLQCVYHNALQYYKNIIMLCLYHPPQNQHIYLVYLLFKLRQRKWKMNLSVAIFPLHLVTWAISWLVLPALIEKGYTNSPH